MLDFVQVIQISVVKEVVEKEGSEYLCPDICAKETLKKECLPLIAVNIHILIVKSRQKVMPN